MMRWLSYIAVLLLPMVAVSQVEFTATVNKTSLTTDQRLQYSITTNTNGDITPPSFNDFKIIFGPSVSQEIGYTNINGHYTLSKTVTYTYIIQPKSEGDFTINPSVLEANGKKYFTEGIKITVSKNTADSYSTNSKIFLKMSVNKDVVYQGEPVVVTYYLYAKWPDIRSMSYEMPQYAVQNGFWTQSFDQGDPQFSDDMKTINGMNYRYAVLYKEILIPLHNGELELDPFTMKISANPSMFNSGTPFDLKSNSETITVKPLPEPVPEDFTGAVGDFSMNITIDSSALKTGEPVNIVITVDGKGNLKLIDDIILDFPGSFELFEPQSDENIRTTLSGMSGQKVYRYLVIPRNAGKHSIGPLSYSYFDPKSGTYKTMYEGELIFDIAKGDGDAVGSITLLDKQDVELINEDIRHISSNTTSLTKKGGGFFGTALYYVGLTVPGLAFLLFFFVRRRHHDLMSDEVAAKNRKANSVAAKRLATAQALLGQSDSNTFHEEIMRALYGYLSDKLNMPVSETSKETILHKLEEKGISNKIGALFISVLERCEMARYSPADIQSEQTLYEDATHVITTIETQLKK